MDKTRQIEFANQFRDLHHSPNLLLLPNAWDVGSAVIFERADFPALATTSAGVAFALGYPDGQQIPLSDVLDVVASIVRRIHIPLSVDFEAGYGTTPAEIAHNVQQVIALGAVGINFEDADSDDNLIPLDEQIARIRALATLKAEIGIPFFINARTDIYLLQIGEADQRLSQTIERCKAFVDAGADGVFVPGKLNPSEISQLVSAVSAPLNILALPANPPPTELQNLGVKRMSIGSGAARAALGITQKIAHELHEQGSLATMFAEATPYDAINRLFET